MPTTSWGRSSLWINALYEGGYYDLFMDGTWIGYTLDREAQLEWVMRGGITERVVTTIGQPSGYVADMIIDHALDGVI